MADPWAAARRAARATRAALLGEYTNTAGAETALRAALRDAGLVVTPLRPTDNLLCGAHAVLSREMDSIWVRSDLSTWARRLLIAHELAHHYLHPEYVESEEYSGAAESDSFGEGADYLVGYGPRERRESEANVWAREFLLPGALAQQLFRHDGLSAAAIAERVGVPLAAVYAGLAVGAPTGSPVAARTEAPSGPTTGLDASQAAAAYADHGPLLIGAGPGTGKTRTLTARVRYLLQERGVAPENILCLTFSRKAAAELMERIAAETDPATARRLTVCTFHAFGLDLLRRYWKEAGLPPRPALLTTAEAFALLEGHLPHAELSALRYLHDPTFPLPDVLRLIGRLKEEMVTPSEALERAEAADAPRLRDAAKLYGEYETLLRTHGAIDFADLVCRAVSLLEENPLVRRSEQARWQQVLVDEYQDVNRAGARLVRALGGSDGAGIWCVGDLRQAIYRFRGASPANVTRFAADFPGGERRDLAVNYRAVPPLVALIGAASGEGTGAWQASRTGESEPDITFAVAPDEAAQTAGIAAAMRRLSGTGVPYRDMAVLCRTNGQARALRRALAEIDIPIADQGDTLFWKSREVRELLLLLARGSEPEGLAHRVRPVLHESLTTVTDPAEFFSTALWGPMGYARQVTDTAAVGTLLAIARVFKEQAALLTAEGETAGQAFLRHVRRLARLGDSGLRTTETEEPEVAPDAVRVLTVHGAKGLEFPVVFVPNLSDGRFPSRARPSLIGDGDAHTLLYPGGAVDTDDEEARLFFVALSRARDHLILSRAEKYAGRSAKPSPLLGRLDLFPGLHRVEWPPVPADSAPVPPPPVGAPPPASDTPVFAREAEAYLRCPRRYYYETVRGWGEFRRKTAFDGFRRAILSALKASDPLTALAAAWREHGPEPNDPWYAAYLREAEAVLARIVKPVSGRGPTSEKPLPHLVPLAGTNLAVLPDAAPDGTDAALERFSFRRPPTDESGRPKPERLNTLLFAATPEGKATRVRYLLTGETLPIKPAPQSKKAHLAQYERAIHGMRLQVFPPEPEEPGDCAECAYLFICPDE